MLATSVQLANTQQALTSAQGNYQNAVAQLNNILGLPVETEIAASSEINFVRYNLSEADCLEYALNHRPDGISANFAVKQAQAQTSAVKSGYRPNVNAVVQGNMSGENIFGSNHNAERWSVGLQMDWNIFDNGVTAAQVQQSKSAERKAESLALQQIEQIQLEVHNAYINLKTAEKNIATTAAAVDKAEEEFSISQIRYVEGVDTNLNVMNAQEKVVETRNNYYTALYNYNTSRAQLEKAMGVPVAIDALIYAESLQNGNSADKALEISTVQIHYIGFGIFLFQNTKISDKIASKRLEEVFFLIHIDKSVFKLLNDAPYHSAIKIFLYVALNQSDDDLRGLKIAKE